MFTLLNRKTKFNNNFVSISAGQNGTSFADVKISGNGRTIVSTRNSTTDLYVSTMNTAGVWNNTVLTASGNGVEVALSENGLTFITGDSFNRICRIYNFNGSTWVSTNVVEAASFAGDNYGGAVAISKDGNYFSVGANHNNNADPRAYVYTHSSGTYNKVLTVSGITDNDARTITNLGQSVALNANGSTLLVGVPRWDTGTGAGNDDIGAMLVYTRSGASWTQQAILNGTNSLGLSANAQLSYNRMSLSDDGNLAIVNSFETQSLGGFTVYGKAYLFRRVGASWSFVQAFTIPAPYSSNLQLMDVSISGNGKHIALILSNRVHVYSFINKTWVETNVFTNVHNSGGLNTLGNIFAGGFNTVSSIKSILAYYRG